MLRNKHQSGISSNFAHLSKNLLHSSKRRIHDVLKAQSSGRPTSEYIHFIAAVEREFQLIQELGHLIQESKLTKRGGWQAGTMLKEMSWHCKKFQGGFHTIYNCWVEPPRGSVFNVVYVPLARYHSSENAEMLKQAIKVNEAGIYSTAYPKSLQVKRIVWCDGILWVIGVKVYTMEKLICFPLANLCCEILMIFIIQKDICPRKKCDHLMQTWESKCHDDSHESCS